MNNILRDLVHSILEVECIALTIGPLHFVIEGDLVDGVAPRELGYIIRDFV